MTIDLSKEPLGSTSPYVLFANAHNLDIAVNSITSAIWMDRFGRSRTTLRGMEQRFNLFIQNSGYKVIGDYEDGPLTIDEYNQLIRYDGELWKLTALTSIPFTTSGTDSASWGTDQSHFVSVGDGALRQTLFVNEMVNLSPLYYGAAGDGATDDTAAFELLETETTGRVIDLGGRSFAVTKSFTKNNYINGSFLRTGSHRIAIGDLKARDKQLPLVHSGMPKTYNARHTLRRTEGAGGIFAVIQGCCYDEINDKIFTLSSTTALGYCINAFAVTNAGELGSYDRTRSVELGHQGLGCHHLPDGSPVLWTSKPYQDGAADQCVSMENILSYTGTTDNVTSGFTTWQVFPASTDSASSTPTVSSCQNYLIAKKIAADGLTCTVRVFDLKVMWANRATKTDYSEDYLVEFSYQKPSADSLTQSIACDGTFIYILESHTYTGMSNFIYVFELTGRFVERVDITTVGDAEAIADNTGTPVYKEPESLTVIKTEAGYVLTIGICTPIGVLENGKNVYLFDLGCSGSVVQSKASRSVASKTGLHGAGSPNYKYGVKEWNDTFHWTVQPTRKGIQTNRDNPVLFLDGGITGGIQLASNDSEGMSNSWASRHDNAAEGPRSILLKSRSGQVSSDVFGAVQAGDRLGTRVWAGDTGTKLVQAAHIKCNVMAAPTADAVPTALYFGTTTAAGAYGDRWVLTEAGHWRPSGANAYDIGTSANAVRNIYIANSPIVTCSREYKQDETSLSDAELRVGLAVYLLIKKFRMKAAYAEKGDDARYHIGIIAEDIQTAFEAEGLDAFAYGILCYERWDNEYETVYAKRYLKRKVIIDEETQQTEEVIDEEQYDTGEKRLITPAGEKLSVRTDELMFLAMQALHQNYFACMSDIHSRLSLLEGN
ncbi:hypothetical protein DVA43_24245 [Leclercia sp. W6]|uniref:tail fiber domain-containing protein n=1 Tax=Leclercia sp. W6 TaxID=2282310 RepID=UPI000DF40F80|nr:hypothetical protein [Leclercia sp. W6]AXF62418.1 hypothetical protein DVA43_24245 [Leclercia sp. W6]